MVSSRARRENQSFQDRCDVDLCSYLHTVIGCPLSVSLRNRGYLISPLHCQLPLFRFEDSLHCMRPEFWPFFVLLHLCRNCADSYCGRRLMTVAPCTQELAGREGEGGPGWQAGPQFTHPSHPPPALLPLTRASPTATHPTPFFPQTG